MDGVYLTWLISALAIGVILMPFIKPPWAKVTMDVSLTSAKILASHRNSFDDLQRQGLLDEVDNLMANTDGMLNMTFDLRYRRRNGIVGPRDQGYY